MCRMTIIIISTRVSCFVTAQRLWEYDDTLETMECPASMGATAECSDPTLTPLKFNAYKKL